LPHLRPPTATAYEEDRDALTAQFDAAEALLKEIQTETAAVRVAVEEQREKVDKTTQDVEEAVKEMRDRESKTRDEMREIREEVNNIREMLPRVKSSRRSVSCKAHEISQMIEKNKDSQTQSLAELQQELKSLKALLLSRGSGLSPSPSSPLPFPGRPSIPAWQLAGPSNGVDGSDISSTSTAPLSSPGFLIPPVNDKGKAVEMTPKASNSS
jgi:peroxin-14